MGNWYASREEVKSALDYKETARNDGQVDRAIERASRVVEGLLHRRFYPELTTRYFDWPNQQYARAWRLWLGSNELISVSSIVSGGLTLSASNYFLRRSDNLGEPPYDSVELLLSTNATFGGGSTHQKDIAIAGLWGYDNVTSAAGATSEVLDSSETGVDVTDSSLVGVGDLITVDSERMTVTGKTMLDTTVDIHASDSLTASNADVSILCSAASGIPVVGEVILIDSERMLVIDLAGTTLTVKRAWDGSVLATHAAGASIFAPRTLTVVRGALGTTAAAHLTAAPILRQEYPGPVRSLCVAESVVQLLNEIGGYARTAGTGDNAREAAGRALNDARMMAFRSFGRQLRTGVV
jgi:hypothetical protein